MPFSKPSERYASILGGHANALYEQAGDVAPFLNNKQMRPLLIFGKQRLPAFKDTPSSLGIPVALPQFRAIVVRAGTPADIVERLPKTLADVAHTEEYKKFLAQQFAVPSSFKDASMAPAYVSAFGEDLKVADSAGIDPVRG